MADIRANDRRYSDTCVVLCVQDSMGSGITTVAPPLATFYKMVDMLSPQKRDAVVEQLPEMLEFKRGAPLDRYILVAVLPNVVAWMRGRYDDFVE